MTLGMYVYVCIFRGGYPSFKVDIHSISMRLIQWIQHTGVQSDVIHIGIMLFALKQHYITILPCYGMNGSSFSATLSLVLVTMEHYLWRNVFRHFFAPTPCDFFLIATFNRCVL